MADELYLLKIHGLHGGQHSEVGMHFHGSNLTLDETFENARDLVASFVAGPLDPFTACLPASYEVKRVSARREVPVKGVEYNQDFQVGDWPGQLGTEAASNQLCPIVRLIPPMAMTTAGRFFLPCIGESEINANTPSAGWITAVGDFMDSIISNFGSGSIVWLNACYSKKTGVYLNTVTYDFSSTVGWQMKRAKPH